MLCSLSDVSSHTIVVLALLERRLRDALSLISPVDCVGHVSLTVQSSQLNEPQVILVDPVARPSIARPSSTRTGKAGFLPSQRLRATDRSIGGIRATILTYRALLHRSKGFTLNASDNMPLKQRRSVAPNLDLGSFAMDKTAKGSSPLTPGPHSADGLTPLTPRSPRSSPTSPFARGTTIRPVTQDTNLKPVTSFFHSSHSDTEPTTPGLTAIPQYPPSPKESPKHNRDASKSFFANLKAPRSSHRLDKSDGSGHSLDKPKSRGSSQDRKTYISSKQYGSTPDLLSTGDAATYPSTGESSGVRATISMRY